MTEAQYASLVLPVLLAAVAAPFGLSASINFANRQGLANIDEAEDATSALNKAHNIYYQMHLRCKNSWGLVQGILHEATARNLEVIDVRITTAGKDADDVFYVRLAFIPVVPTFCGASRTLRRIAGAGLWFPLRCSGSGPRVRARWLSPHCTALRAVMS